MNRNLFSVEKSFIATGALYCKARLVPSQLIFFNYSSLPPPPIPPTKKKKRKETWYRDSQLSDFKQRVRSKDFGAARVKDGRGFSQSPGPLKESRREKLTHYLAACFCLFTRLILNVALLILLVKRFSIS